MSHSSFTDDSHDIFWNAVLTLVQPIPISAPEAALAVHYGQWTMAVKLFRFVEEWRMYRQEPTPRDIVFHKILTTALISTGELLRWQLAGVDSSQLAQWGLSVEAAEINVHALEDSYAEWHMSVSKERQNALQKTIFASDGNPPSSN